MKGSIIEIVIIAFILTFMIISCSNKTSIFYEMGKEFRNVKAEFMRGLED